MGAAAKEEPSAAARAVADLDARLAALRKQGTAFELRPQYEALQAEAAAIAERHAADPDAARAYWLIARCCEALGKHPEKEAAFARYIDALLAHSKERAAAELKTEAEALIARRELFPAIKMLRLMLSKFPDGPDAAYALYRLGTCHLWLDQFEDATTDLGEVIERWPKSDVALHARLRLARASLLQKRHGDATELLEEFLATQPDAPGRDAALFDLATARYLAHDPYGSLVAFQRLIREAPKSPYADVARAWIAKLRGDVLQQIDRTDR